MLSKKKNNNNTNSSSKVQSSAGTVSPAESSGDDSFIDVGGGVSTSNPPPHVTTTTAVIGGGVSGLAAAWHLQCNNGGGMQVDLFEKEAQLGGHAWTVDVPLDYHGETMLPVDIGFMVLNEENYPNLVEWFEALQVPLEDSDMSLSVSLDGGQTVEWSSDGLSGLLGANWKQALKPTFYQFLQDMLRFNREAAEILILHDDDPRKHISTCDYLRQNQYSSAFQTYYLLPMMAALWSASLEDVLQFPAIELIGFLCNHKMLQLFERPLWKTVAGRSRQYVQAVERALGSDRVHCNTAIGKVDRVVVDSDDDNNKSNTIPKYQLTTSDGTVLPQLYDHVVFACHPPTAAKMLQDNHDDQHSVKTLLQQIEYADNVVYVHSDPSLMPRTAWASWNCLGKSRELVVTSTRSKHGEALEGAESGFGNRIQDADKQTLEPNQLNEAMELEGESGRFKAVYVT